MDLKEQHTGWLSPEPVREACSCTGCSPSSELKHPGLLQVESLFAVADL